MKDSRPDNARARAGESRRGAAAMVVLLLLVAGLHSLMLWQAPAPKLFGDEGSYLGFARRDVEAGTTSLLPGHLRYDRRPELGSRLYAQVDRPGLSVEERVLRIGILQLVMLLGLLVVVYGQARLLGLRPTGAVSASALLGLFPWFGFYVYAVWPAIPHALFLGFAFLCLLAYLKTLRLWWLIPAGLALAYALFTKGSANAFVPVIALLIAVANYRTFPGIPRRQRWLRAAAASGVLLATLMATIAPQLVRNFREGHGVRLAANRWDALEAGLRGVHEDYSDPRPPMKDRWAIDRDYMEGGTTWEQREVQARWRTLAYIDSTPLFEVVERQSRKLFWCLFRSEAFFEQSLGYRSRWGDPPPRLLALLRRPARALWYVILVLALAGLASKVSRSTGWFLLALFTGYLLVALFAVPQKLRYAMPVVPTLCVFAGAAVERGLQRGLAAVGARREAGADGEAATDSGAIRIPGPRTRGLHVFALLAFALVQPLFDLMERHVEFLVAHRMDAGDLLLIALVLGLGIPGLVVLAKWGLERIAGAMSGALHLAAVALLVGAIALPLLKRFEPAPGLLLAAVAALLGVAAAAAYARVGGVRIFATALAPMGLVSPLYFLFGSSTEPLLHPWTPQAAVGAEIETDVPVVVLVFDGLPTSLLLDESGQVDAIRHPNFAALASEASWFRNATTVAEETNYAVPAILSGVYPDRKMAPLASNYPQNLFTVLAPSHDLNVEEPVTRLCPDELCAAAPRQRHSARLASLGSDLLYLYLHLLLPTDWTQALPPVTSQWKDFAVARGSQTGPDPRKQGLRQAFSGFLERIEDRERPGLHFAHLNLPHRPYTYTPSGKSYGAWGRVRKGDPDLAFDQQWAAVQALQRHLLQLEYADALLGRLRRRLEWEGLYDRALLVVTADHGRGFQAGSSGRRISRGDPGVADILMVPLFIKLPGQREGRVSDRNVETIDILPTIIDVLGGARPTSLDGRSVFDASAPERQNKIAYGERPSHADRSGHTRQEFVFGPSFPSHSERVVARIHGIFDLRAGRDGLFAVGPNRELVQRSVAALSLDAPSPFTLSLDEPARYRDVQPESSFMPAFVTGVLEASEIPSDPLDLAVAVNGTIRAVTRSHDHAEHAVRFAAMVPESAFRAGGNQVEVFVVAKRGGELSLAPTRSPLSAGSAGPAGTE